MKSIERHHLKEDEFITSLHDTFTRIEEHRRQVLWAIVALVVIAVAAGGVIWWRQDVNTKAAALLAEFKRSHYRGWLDVPLPALGGRTPRHAARLKTVRPRLIDLLKELESHETRAATSESPAYDFGWMWRELGLE